jgi:hypothetical protein
MAVGEVQEEFLHILHEMNTLRWQITRMQTQTERRIAYRLKRDTAAATEGH